MNEPTVLLIDDDPLLSELVSGLVHDAGYEIETACTGAEALERLSRPFEGVILLDVHLPDTNGPELLPNIQRECEGSPVVVLTGQGTTELALRMIAAGAYDFLDKHQVQERLVELIDAAMARLDAPSFPGIIAQSPAMKQVFRSLARAADSGIPVLVRGESGTGKELIARAVHARGPRTEGPFVAVNCAGIPEHLLESEIFGYEKGAFTGAAARKPGRFDAARGGTLFLDEIGEMAPAMQSKLLRVLQEGEYVRLGGTQVLKSDARVVSATHRDLEAMVAAGTFREDLYYRLSVFTITVPRLSKRDGDVGLLARHFVGRAAAREGKSIRGIDARALELLRRHSYPGNVRELENTIAHAVVACDGPMLTIAHLPPAFRAAALLAVDPKDPVNDTPLHPEPVTWHGRFKTMKEVEREHMQLALDRCGGNKTDAAALLGVSRMTLYRKLETWAAEDAQSPS